MANPLFGNWKLKGKLTQIIRFPVSDYPLSAESRNSRNL